MMGYLEMAKQVEQRMVREKIPCAADPQPEKVSGWKAVRYVDGRPLPLSEKEISDKTVMELVNGPHVVRFDLPKEGRVYFIGLDDDLHRRLTSEGKTVRWLHELFEGIRRDLVRKGLSSQTSVYRWTIGQIWNHQVALEVFPGSREIRE